LDDQGRRLTQQCESIDDRLEVADVMKVGCGDEQSSPVTRTHSTISGVCCASSATERN